VRVAAPDAATATSVLEDLRELFPAPEPIARHDVPVAFWTYTPNGPMPSLRPIAVPEWDEIRGNYASETRARLDAIMRGFNPAHGGQLILWHGHRQDLRAARACLGVARVVPTALRGRSGHVFRRARRLEHGIDAEPDGGARILASLYAELEGFDPAKPQASVGFGAEG
jgi:hypothetical protein